jgi:hypothetical protein
MFPYVLRDAETMDDVGVFTSATSAWGLGEPFTTGDGRRLRIVDMLPSSSPDVRDGGVWLVEPADA